MHEGDGQQKLVLFDIKESLVHLVSRRRFSGTTIPVVQWLVTFAGGNDVHPKHEGLAAEVIGMRAPRK